MPAPTTHLSVSLLLVYLIKIAGISFIIGPFVFRMTLSDAVFCLLVGFAIDIDHFLRKDAISYIKEKVIPALSGEPGNPFEPVVMFMHTLLGLIIILFICWYINNIWPLIFYLIHILLDVGQVYGKGRFSLLWPIVMGVKFPKGYYRTWNKFEIKWSVILLLIIIFLWIITPWPFNYH